MVTSMLEFVICEDNETYLQLIASWVKDILEECSIPGKILLSTGHPVEVAKLIAAGTGNVFLLDINLNAPETGLDLAKQIRAKSTLPYIVFITEHNNHILDSFQTRPFDFLPKPVSWNKLKQCIVDIHRHNLDNYSPATHFDDCITIKFSTNVHRIKKADIIFIEKFRNKSVIHTLHSDITCYQSLEFFESSLQDTKSFIRCHKSYLVNINQIKEVHFNKLEILFHSGEIRRMGRAYKEGLKDLWPR